MEIEYEACFENVDKNDVRKRLKAVGAVLVKPEFLMKRNGFFLPRGFDVKGGWARVRHEGDKITMSIKVVDGDTIKDKKEICLVIDDYRKGCELLEFLGCKNKTYQESKRELWRLGDTEITIDEWPFLEPYIEIEGKSEAEVKAISQKLGFDYSKAIFGSVDVFYSKKYGVSEDMVVNRTPRIAFSEENPFVKNK